MPLPPPPLVPVPAAVELAQGFYQILKIFSMLARVKWMNNQ
jgi:hypothetical protein